MKLTLKNIGNEIDITTREVQYFLVLEAENGSVLRVPTTEKGTNEVVSFLYQKPEQVELASSEPSMPINSEDLGKPPELEQGATEFGGTGGQPNDEPEFTGTQEVPQLVESNEAEANDDGRHPFMVNDEEEVPSV